MKSSISKAFWSLISFIFFLPLLVQAQNDTILVFYLKGCARCLQTESFLSDKKIPHKIFYYEVPEDQKKLGKYLNQIGFKKGQTLEFPVVVKAQQVHLNIPDLPKFFQFLEGANKQP